MKRTSAKYKTGFSTNSLMLKEAISAVLSMDSFQEFMKGNEDIDPQSLPVQSEASRKRWSRELSHRLKALGDSDFLNLFTKSNTNDQSLILFYATCKYYQLITEYMLEHVLNKWRNLDLEIKDDEFETYLYSKMKYDPELANLAESTIHKLSTNMNRMLIEVGLVVNGKLHKQEFNPAVLKLVYSNGDVWFLHAMLLNESEIKTFAQP